MRPLEGIKQGWRLPDAHVRDVSYRIASRNEEALSGSEADWLTAMRADRDATYARLGVLRAGDAADGARERP